MTGIKVFLVSSFLGIALWALRNRARVGLRAGARVGVLAVAVLAVSSVLDPDLPQWAAERVGVTRGTDLVLYLFVVVFTLVSIGHYLRFREMEHRFATLVRQKALDQVLAPLPPDEGRDEGAPRPEL